MSFGVLGGLGGVVHGIGEIMQGSVRPEGMFIRSWAEGPIALYFDGDLAISFIPNMLYTGIATLLVSTLMMVWSGAFIGKRGAGQVLIALAIILLLVGGGVGPPTLALLAGIAGLGIHSKHRWWRKHVKENARRILAKTWPYVFALCLGNGVFNVVGHVVAAYWFAPVDGKLFLHSFLLSLPLLIASIVTGIQFDIRNKRNKNGHI